MSTHALVVILVTTFITLILWILSIPTLPTFSQGTWHQVSQLAANLATVFMGVSLVLSMRLHLFEKLFGGLDKNYKLHAFIGSFSFVLMLVHPFTLILNVLINYSSSIQAALQSSMFYLVPGQRLAANLGITAFYIVIFAMLFTKVIKIPYQYWLTTHRLFGIAFLFAAFHAYLAPSKLVRSPLLASWIGMWILLGLSGALYSIVLYRLFGKRYHYTISKITKTGDVLNILLQPLKEKIQFDPGQFMYIRFRNRKLGTEMHPFSVTSSPVEKELRFSIKTIGDYTKSIEKKIKAGEETEVYGPYGTFGNEYLQGKGPMVWIAGGIGVTPFLSILHAEYQNQRKRPTLFYYAVNRVADAIFDTEIKKITKYLPHISYRNWVVADQGILSAKEIVHEYVALQNKTPDHIPMPKFLLCGPHAMIQTFTKQLQEQQMRSDYIIFEDFSFTN